MNCRRVRSVLSNYLESRLPEAASEAVTVHLAGCPICRRFRQELLALGADVREFAAPASPPDLPRRAVERWLAEQRGRGQAADPTRMRSRFFGGTTRLAFS